MDKGRRLPLLVVRRCEVKCVKVQVEAGSIEVCRFLEHPLVRKLLSASGACEHDLESNPCISLQIMRQPNDRETPRFQGGGQLGTDL